MHVIKDWILLLETLIEWEAWLKSDRMTKYQLKRAEKKHRYIMYLMRKIGRRTKGMGLKKMKFHGIIHYVMDILHFGVPMEFDTGSCESGHKRTKTAAKRTQKNPDHFNTQTCKRLDEFHLVDLAMEEINGCTMWDVHCLIDPEPLPTPPNDEVVTGGTRIEVFFDEEDQENSWRFRGRVNSDGVPLQAEAIDFLCGLQDLVYVSKKRIMGNVTSRVPIWVRILSSGNDACPCTVLSARPCWFCIYPINKIY